MTCTRCGRQLKSGEIFCLNCGEPTANVVDPEKREKPSDIVTCLSVGLFVLFGIPALLFGCYLLGIGTGFIHTAKKLAGNGVPTIFFSLIPLGVAVALSVVLLRVWIGSKNQE